MNNIEILLLIATTFMGIAGFLAKDKISKIEQELSDLRNDIYEVKENYLDRFERVNKSIVDAKLEILEKIHQLELSIKK